MSVWTAVRVGDWEVLQGRKVQVRGRPPQVPSQDRDVPGERMMLEGFVSVAAVLSCEASLTFFLPRCEDIPKC